MHPLDPATGEPLNGIWRGQWFYVMDEDGIHTGERIHASTGRATHATGYERRDEYLPTPDEIAEACRQIQSEWSDHERYQRTSAHEGRITWSVPVCVAIAEPDDHDF